MRRPYEWLFGALSVPLLCAPAVFGQTAAPAPGQALSYPAKEIAGFRAYFVQIMALESLADQLKAQGKDDTKARRTIQEEARLSAQEASLLKQVAQQCNAAYAAETAAPPPAAVPQQLAALQAQRDAIVAGCMDQLKTEMGTKRFLYLDLYVLVRVADKLKQESLQPDSQPAAADPNLIRAVHPVSEAADRLRKSYAMVVTYEDPPWEFPGEMIPWGPKVTAEMKGVWNPDWVSFTMPGPASPAAYLPDRLAQVLAAYHQQTGGPRFQVLTSKLGLHVVPLQVRDRDGRLAPARNPFDKVVFIRPEERAAHQHLIALGAAVQAANEGLKLSVSPNVMDTRGDSFNFMFAPTRADDRPFVWGTGISNMTGREALIDLLERSATTFYWDMLCAGTASVKCDDCWLRIGPLEIGTVGPDGKPFHSSGQIVTVNSGQRLIEYDRCGGCEGGRALTEAERSRGKK